MPLARGPVPQFCQFPGLVGAQLIGLHRTALPQGPHPLCLLQREQLQAVAVLPQPLQFLRRARLNPPLPEPEKRLGAMEP